MPAPSVWIVNKGNHQYSHAEKYGTLRVLTEGRVNVFALDNLCAEVWAKLDEGGARDGDLVLVSGYAILNSIVSNYFLKKWGRVRFLQWGANRQKYTVLTMRDYGS